MVHKPLKRSNPGADLLNPFIGAYRSVSPSVISQAALTLLIVVLALVTGCYPEKSAPPPIYTTEQEIEDAAPTEQPVGPILSVLCEPHYLPDELVSEFMTQTGITVVIADPTDQPDLMVADGSFDLALIDSLLLSALIDQGILARIDRKAIPNGNAISYPFSAIPFDPDGVFCVPFLWGAFGIVVNRDVVTDSSIGWGILFDHTYTGKIDMPDDIRLVLEVALRDLGSFLGEADTDTLSRAADLLYEQRKITRGYFQISEIVDHLAEGSSYIAYIDGPSASLAIGQNSALEYVVPASGAPLWVLVWVIPASSENRDAALSFINYLLEPARIAVVSNTNRVANTVGDSKPYLDDALTAVPTITPTDDTSSGYRLPGPIDLETENFMMRLKDDLMLK